MGKIFLLALIGSSIFSGCATKPQDESGNAFFLKDSSGNYVSCKDKKYQSTFADITKVNLSGDQLNNCYLHRCVDSVCEDQGNASLKMP